MDTRLLVAAAISVAAGVSAGANRPTWAVPLTAAALWTLGAACVVGLSRRLPWAAVVLALAGVALCGAADSAWRAAADRQRVLPRSVGDEVEVCGTAASRRPRSVQVEAEGIRTRGGAWTVREPVRITGGDATSLRPGSRICARGVVVPARPGRVEPPLLAAERVTVAGVGSPVRHAAATVRDAFRRAATRALPDRQAGLLLGMTDGDVELLDEATVEAFRTTGLAHLVAVSGSNVAVVLAIVLLACRWLAPRSRWLRVAIALPPLVFFAFLTSLEASVLRATVTAGIVLAVTAAGRAADALRAACVAFCVLVLADPSLLSHPGFQLSFAATLGLISWSGPLSARLTRLWPGPPPAGVKAAAVAVATTVSAQVAVAPLLALHFGRLPAAGGLANLVVAPLAGVVMVGGMTTLALAATWGALAWAPATLRVLLDAILWVARTFAALPGASVRADVVGALTLVGLLVWLVAKHPRIRIGALAVAVACGGASIGTSAANRAIACDGPQILGLDIGGTAVLLKASGRSVLYDGGPSGRGIVDLLRDHGVSHLDVVVSSHPHADHTQGLVEVVRRIEVGKVVGPPNIAWGPGAELVSAARERGVAVEVAGAGDELAIAPDLRLVVLAPEREPPPDEPSDHAIGLLNLVIRAQVGSTSIVLPGDANGEAQAAVASADPDSLRSPVLLAVHHGSADLEPTFVDAVAAGITLVTVDPDNRYGHPREVALRMYSAHGTVLRTDTQGTLSVCVRPGGLEVTTTR
ncbi:MAG TPA: ComEC/Rec2 family competence protein [Actinomycetota bacterium]|nr:ComEC/Rec2 family competence protein [Actinomycetota bacterium]